MMKRIAATEKTRERLRALIDGRLGTGADRSDLVRLFYVDCFDQTCGRNRGYRGQQRREHIAVFPPRLNGWLAAAKAREVHA